MFKKGTQVWIIKSWDRKGTVYARQAIVDSCHEVQMHLRLLDGKMTRRREYLSHINRWEPAYIEQVHVIVGTVDEAREHGLKLAQAILDAQIAHFNRCLEDRVSTSQAYKDHVKGEIAQLHEPRFIIDGLT